MGRRLVRRGVLLAVVAVQVGGCARSPGPSAGEPAVGPRQVIAQLRALRAQRQYGELRGLVLPGRAEEVIATLMAVDGFLDANARLCAWLRDEVGVGVAQSVDQSDVADALGLFSREAELLDENITGRQATVSFAVGERLPAQNARLRQEGGRWYYDPEKGYAPELPAAFREMARGMERVQARLAGGSISKRELLDNPTRLMEEVRSELKRGVQLLSQARRAAEDEARRAAREARGQP